MDEQQSIAYAKKYLEDVLAFFGLNTDVTATHEDEVIELQVPSSYLNGFLIGQRGDTLRALQFLVSQALKNDEASLVRVNIDIADYKKQRAERLSGKVDEWADKVVASGKPYHVQPMNAADRRIVHNVISEKANLRTSSEGEGRERHVVIFPVEVPTEE